MTETRTFLGMTIEGEIARGSRAPVAQRPVTDLKDALSALLDHPAIGGIRWKQYTPYFNDGEPCEFGISQVEAGVKSPTEIKPDPYSDYGDYYAYDLIWSEDGPGYEEWKRLVGDYRYDKYPTKIYDGNGVYPELGPLFNAFDSLLESGAFDDGLLELFGDHANITIRPGEPVQVEFYEHD